MMTMMIMMMYIKHFLNFLFRLGIYWHLSVFTGDMLPSITPSSVSYILDAVNSKPFWRWPQHHLSHYHRLFLETISLPVTSSIRVSIEVDPKVSVFAILSLCIGTSRHQFARAWTYLEPRPHKLKLIIRVRDIQVSHDVLADAEASVH